jgi:hypothetical protein
MFTWICPQCGREVPPAYNECPNCAGNATGQGAAPQPGQSATGVGTPPTPPYAQAPTYPPQQPYAQAPAYPPPPYMQPPPARGVTLPPWLMSIVFAVLFLAIGAALFFGIKHFSGSGEASASAPAAAEKAAPPAGSKAQANMLQKYVEVVGMRLIEDPKKKPEVRFVVVNHSGAEISDLIANVNLWARTAKSDEEAVGTFSIKVPSLGPYETKEMSAALTTKLKVYELPDWQNLVAEVQITSPQ